MSMFRRNIIARKAMLRPVVQPTYLTQWKIVGNSEVHDNEIWSCGEYNPIDGKYHILVQPQGGSVADIALDEPLRKVNNVADTIEFPSGTNGKALVTRNLASVDLGDLDWTHRTDITQGFFATNLLNRNYSKFDFVALCANWIRWNNSTSSASGASNMPDYNYVPYYLLDNPYSSICYFKNSNYNTTDAFKQSVSGIEFIYNLATPTTELVDAPQVEEADSYSCVISQGGKAVSWSDFKV